MSEHALAVTASLAACAVAIAWEWWLLGRRWSRITTDARLEQAQLKEAQLKQAGLENAGLKNAGLQDRGEADA